MKREEADKILHEKVEAGEHIFDAKRIYHRSI
jgi:hypothetical protein